jgi:hypothetical protein
MRRSQPLFELAIECERLNWGSNLMQDSRLNSKLGSTLSSLYCWSLGLPRY